MKKQIDFDVSGGSKTFDEIVAGEVGDVIIAAKASNLSADAVITPLIGPNEDELKEYTDGNLTLVAGASSYDSLILSHIPSGTVQKLKCTVSGTGTINTIQIGSD